jgi:hypothetical protein
MSCLSAAVTGRRVLAGAQGSPGQLPPTWRGSGIRGSRLLPSCGAAPGISSWAPLCLSTQSSHGEGGGAIHDLVPRLQHATHEQVDQLVRAAPDLRDATPGLRIRSSPCYDSSSCTYGFVGLRHLAHCVAAESYERRRCHPARAACLVQRTSRFSIGTLCIFDKAARSARVSGSG